MHASDILLIILGSMGTLWLTWKMAGPLLSRGTDPLWQPRERGAGASEGDVQLELERLRIAERREIREQHERLLRHKLDILKTAVTSGYDEDQLAALDDRLTQHIDDGGLRQLQDGQSLTATPSAAGVRPRTVSKPAQIG